MDQSRYSRVPEAKMAEARYTGTLKREEPLEWRRSIIAQKYWYRRYLLFSKFDEGIKMDDESWYSVTPEQVAKETAERCSCGVIVDAFCGVGGNAIQFARTCGKVIAIDIDPGKIEMARHNARIYGVADNIHFIVGDFLKLAPTLRADVVFLSPPWGGPGYARVPVYNLETMLQPVPLSTLLAATRKVASNYAAFLPRNSNTYHLVQEAGLRSRLVIRKDMSGNRLIGITAYYYDLPKKKN